MILHVLILQIAVHCLCRHILDVLPQGFFFHIITIFAYRKLTQNRTISAFALVVAVINLITENVNEVKTHL